MTNEKIDKRKKPTRRITCPDCGTEYAVTSFKLHRCAAHNRQQWIKADGNEDRYKAVLKGNVELDMSTSEQLEQIPETGTKSIDKPLENQVNEQHITQVKIQPEEINMSEEKKTEEKTEEKESTKEHEYNFQCGECGHLFDKRTKFCGGCGTKF